MRGQPTEFAQSSSVGAHVRLFRERAGLTQEALAERAGLGISTLKALEHDRRRRPHLHTLGRVADALGLSAGEREALLTLPNPATAVPADASPARDSIRTALPYARSVRLPMLSTPLLGREVELAQICAHLDPQHPSTRLLTLVGPGGVGKTRLALEAAAVLIDAYADEALFVDLAPLHDSRLVAATIARALDLREGGGRSAHKLLMDYLAERQLLLVLDNFEHLLAARELVVELLQSCERLTMLVTSRVALRLRVERRMPVLPLESPPADLTSLQELAESPAVRLFVNRAQAIDASFVLQPSTAPVVGAICRHLDGLPLAIELAAARIGLLTPGALLRRLEQRLALLTGGMRDLPQRQQGLRDTLAWSHDLLGPAEQQLFRRLAVFAGGWTVDAAEAVVADAALPREAVVDCLQTLVDSSLVRRLDDTEGEPRFGMLETIREYAIERLEAAGEAAEVARRQLGWCLELVQPVTPGPVDPLQLGRIVPEYANMRAALREAMAAGAAEEGLWLAAALWMTWYLRGAYAEGRAWLTDLLALPEAESAPHARAHAWLAAGHLAYCQGDYLIARRLLQDALTLADQHGDERLGGAIRHNLAHIARWRGDLEGAHTLYASALTIFRQLHDRLWEATVLAVLASVLFEQGRLAEAGDCAETSLAFFTESDNAWGMARSLYALGRVAVAQGDHTRARSLFERSVTLHRGVGDHQGRAWSLVALAHQLLRDGDFEAAGPMFKESVMLAEMTGDNLTLARSLEALAGLLVTTSPDRAVRLAGAADAVRTSLGAAAQPLDREQLAAWLSGARRELGSERFAWAWAGGQRLGVSRAAAEAQESILATN